MPKQNNTNDIFQFKITLNDIEPKIWRRILVPADYTFFDLHCAIQNAMGWTDSHLHSFDIENKKAKNRIIIQCPSPDGEDWDIGETRDERIENIADYFNKSIKQCVYCYDFGDNWDHTVIFERALPRVPKNDYPQCAAGGNACPPEDCGSVCGYSNLQEILKNKDHEEHEDMLNWLGIDDPKDFDPYEFDPSGIDFEDSKKRLAEWNEMYEIHKENI